MVPARATLTGNDFTFPTDPPLFLELLTGISISLELFLRPEKKKKGERMIEFTEERGRRAPSKGRAKEVVKVEARGRSAKCCLFSFPCT